MTKYFIGTSGWNYRHWEGKFYPRDIKKKDWFSFYAGNFSTVEVNYSFYRWPSEKVIKNWYQKAPEGFEYTLKAPRTITHIKRFRNAEKQVRDFYKLTDLLKEKFGCHLFQAPPSFHKTEENMKNVKAFLKLLDGRKRNVIEFRHESWWDEEIQNLLGENNVTFCTVSGLGMPDDIIRTNRFAYFRFHGKRYFTRYSQKELKKYAEEMKKMRCERLYAYFNNDANAYAVENAKELKEMM